jgi:hypothetical protein
MPDDALKAVHNALAAMPSREEVRQRIAENLHERQVLRQMLRLIEQRQQRPSATAEGLRPEGRDE